MTATIDWNTAVTRTWLRDGTQNLMPLKEAVQNLRSNCEECAEMSVAKVAELLLADEMICTNLAAFEVHPV